MPSVVEYFSSRQGHCGYCDGSSRSSSMWAHALTPRDYQDLIDRGWRRSGSYCYKPDMKNTCCPLYTIKCEALDFKPSKSQKKLLKRVSKYLIEGKQHEPSTDKSDEESSAPNEQGLEMIDISPEKIQMSSQDLEKANLLTGIVGKTSAVSVPPKGPSLDESAKRTQSLRPGEGMDNSKPLCKKAKLIRLEKKKAKNGEEASKKQERNQEKSLEDFIHCENPIFQLELRLVSSEPPCEEFDKTFEESFSVYHKYQTTIHNDSPNQCNKVQFRRFLVTSPLKKETIRNGLTYKYGSYHQQYRLNGKIIAVGVIDILPTCVSSVYFYYDPDYSFLSLGTYSSLREIALVRSLNKAIPELKYYYMGFYIHNLQKMSYKARFSPSFLLCPEAYTWHRIEEAKQKLDVSKYSRLAAQADEDTNRLLSINDVLLLWNRSCVTYGHYKRQTNADEDSEIQEYGQLVGRKCAETMLLYRSAD